MPINIPDGTKRLNIRNEPETAITEGVDYASHEGVKLNVLMGIVTWPKKKIKTTKKKRSSSFS